MTTIEPSLRRSPLSNEVHANPTRRDLPLLPSTNTTSNNWGLMPHSTEAMDTSPDHHHNHNHGSRESHGHADSSPPGERNGERDGQTNGGIAPAVGAAAAAQQPKAVSAAFIHKLYSMLEDQSIQHLISWSSTNESFVMSPSTEFSKVLASYFKHTNISSFVRQLNMYGFHKVSDVFHTGSPDSPLWEFKHGNNNFRRGDLNGLRDIKRRASKHTLIHRDSFSSAPKMTIQPPPPPPPGAPTIEAPMTDPVESRISMLEYHLNDMHARLSRTEEAYASLSSKCQTLSEGLSHCHYWGSKLSSQLLVMVPDPENAIHRDVSALRAEISRQADVLRSQDAPASLQVTSRPVYAPAHPFEPSLPVSPRQQAFDPSRRPSLQPDSRTTSFRAPMPPHLTVSPRRYGSMSGHSGINGSVSPSSIRPPPPPAYQLPPPPAAPQAQPPRPPQAPQTGSPPPMSMLRRHTSADIRLQGWQGQAPPPPPPPASHAQAHIGSPYASGQNSAQWPSSPYRHPVNGGDEQLRNALAQYELPRATAHHVGSRQGTPPPEAGPPSYANPNHEGWQLPGPKFPFKGIEASQPPTRRSSMASNVHSLLNPADTAEREGEDEGPDDRKRKRLA